MKIILCRYNKQTHYKSTLYAKSFLSCWTLPTMIDKNAVNMTDSIFKANAQDTQDIFWSVQQLCTLLGGVHFISCKLLENQDFLQHEGFCRVFFSVLDLHVYSHVMAFFFFWLFFLFLFFRHWKTRVTSLNLNSIKCLQHSYIVTLHTGQNWLSNCSHTLLIVKNR